MSVGTATATAPKKSVRKGAKGKRNAKKRGAKKAKGARKERGLNAKAQKVVDYLAKHDATIASRAIDREKVWKACEVGMGVIATLKAKGLLVRVDHEDGSKHYHLTAEGKKLASK